MGTSKHLAIALAAVGFTHALLAADDDLKTLDSQNVVWTSPSENAAGAMPLGNGELGVNLWAEPDGDLLLLISRTDAWSECCRLLKIGRVRLSITPNPFAQGTPFRQELKLRDGRVEIAAGAGAGAVRLQVFVEADRPVIHVAGQSTSSVEVKATLENWRTGKRVLQGGELGSSWTMLGAPKTIEVWESGDTVAAGPQNAVVWYHRNAWSAVPVTLKHQGLEAAADKLHDPLARRTFGGWMAGQGLVNDGRTTLRSERPVRQFALKIAAHASQPETARQWIAEAQTLLSQSPEEPVAAEQTSRWWHEFWRRSWIFVEEGDESVAVPTNSHPLRLGADAHGGSRFSGLMSRASVYQRALREAEIETLASVGPGREAAVRDGLIATWSLGALKDGQVPSAVPGGPGVKAVGPIATIDESGIPAARFDGGFLEVGADPRLGFSRGFTQEAWIRLKPGAAAARIFDKITPGGADGFLLDTLDKFVLRLIVGHETMSQQAVLTPGKWIHVAATFDPASGARWLFVDGKPVAGSGSVGQTPCPSPITRAYVLQRWMMACAGRGNYPIKFNGSIFTVEPKVSGVKEDFNPDWRRWGDCYWWQNTRLPYAPMPASGDFEMMKPLFRMFRQVTPICAARAEIYNKVKGVYFPETMTMFGTYSNADYGWNRKGHEPNEVVSPWWRYAWQQGLELLVLMLDYYEYTGDTAFLNDELLPMAREVLLYFDTRFSRDGSGRLAIRPTQAVETYWFDVVNDTPSVAGLNDVLQRLLALPGKDLPAADRESWKKLRAATPPVPLRTDAGKTFILPAQQFNPKRSNCENPELYAIWPFRCIGLGSGSVDVGRETFGRRGNKSMAGWSYDGQCAALLGMTDEVRRQIVAKARNSNPKHRFPAIWGPNYDWLPDQCHGGNLMFTLQCMVMQSQGDKIYVLPAWPKNWNVRFLLHAPRQTTVLCVYRNGKLEQLEVTPPSRAKDVIVSDIGKN